MHYTVYRTTNLVNGKVYVGVHVTKNLSDSYLGSGKALKVAIRKYGRSSFKKEVLFVFDNPEDMSAKETELVTREFVDRADTYNLVPGGHQGDSWYRARKKMFSSPEFLELRKEAGRELAAWNAIQDPSFRRDRASKASQEAVRRTRRFSVEEVFDLRRRHGSGESIKSLSREVGVSHSTISDLVNHKSYVDFGS